MTPAKSLDVEHVVYIARKFRYAMEMACQNGEIPTELAYLVEKVGPMFGLSHLDIEIREAKLRLGKDL